jgi:DNA polymerase-3 subunit epsilon
VLDFEATGLDLATDHIVSYGLVPVEHGRAQVGSALYRVVRPPVQPSVESIRVHGIRPGELLEAPPLEDVAQELIDALAGRTLVAHAAWIEIELLGRVCRPHGVKAPKVAVDVLDLAGRLGVLPERGGAPSFRLADLAEECGVPVTRTHHALSDALLTAQVFLVLATALERRGRARVRDLARSPRSQIARSSRSSPLDRTGPVT